MTKSRHSWCWQLGLVQEGRRQWFDRLTNQAGGRREESLYSKLFNLFSLVGYSRCAAPVPLLAIGGTLIFLGNRALAQITPDATLGVERSRITPDAEVRGEPADLIEGGAERGANLFHSFSEFNVEELQRVYFANPAGIENILSRVTGTNPSHILGTLGVDGAANLYLLNPNGIMFGANAQLDIEGSFVASTANSLVFEDGSSFSAANPGDSSLLTVSVPLGLQYGANQAGEIANSGNLSVGQDLTLSAGNLDLQGQLSAGRDLTLEAQDTVRIRDNAIATGGEIKVTADSLSLTEGAVLVSRTRRVGDAGAVKITATDSVRLDGESSDGIPSGIFSQVLPGAFGDSGGIELTTASLELTNGARVIASTGGIGDAGAVKITATDSVRLDGESSAGIPSGIFSTAAPGARGDSGDIFLMTASLELTNGARVDNSTFGEGNAGRVNITATDSVLLDGESKTGIPSGVFSTAASDGNSGEIALRTASLELTNGARVDISTGGAGNAGRVNITATDSVRLDGESSAGIPSGVFSTAASGARGDSGDIFLMTASLELTNGARVDVSTEGIGWAGNVIITATDSVRLDGESSAGIPSGVFSTVASGADGLSGNIELTTASLELTNGARVDASTFGVGSGGFVIITATDSVRLDGESSDGIPSGVFSTLASGAEGFSGDIVLTTASLFLDNNSSISTAVDTDTLGDGGNIRIQTDSLSLENNSQISARSQGTGKAGDITLNVSDILTATDSDIITATTQSAGGSIDITAKDIRLRGDSGHHHQCLQRC